ncbi:hypothetical protein BDP81DRAFT_397579 [Colletotrichum phormii]|uniref:Uncharacterized protein n=1 Tax=Colletotrichum phormii TaxID=359342 RepID=A0AAI9ZJL2_9PEZI|nr:uncharacterized protein BDP81DRAFT_397579 [Colletotrichum phormii]KAK1625808.1 hypothetical protein BDP81DRAFT_397579 [Colletotrichum phormii]
MDHKKQISLTKPTDWPSWIKYIKGKAIDYDLWDLVDPEAGRSRIDRREKPIQPLVSSFMARLVPQTSGTQTRSAAAANAEEHYSTERARDIGDLVRVDRELYIQLRADYNTEKKEYEAEAKALRELRTIITDTARRKYIDACCDQTKPTHEWLMKLRSVAGISSTEIRRTIRGEYQAVLQAKKLQSKQDIERWLESWEAIMLRAEENDMPEATETDAWVESLLKVLANSAISNWAAAYEINGRRDPTIADITAQIRRHLRIHADKLVPSKGNPVKGSFADVEGDNNQKNNSMPIAGSRGQKRHRAMDSIDNDRRCKICNVRCHDMEKCFYIIPEFAPKGWEGRPATIDRVNRMLRENEELEREVKSIRDKLKAEGKLDTNR